MTDSGEPKCYEEEMQVETRKKWEKGMNEEMDSFVRNQTWDLVYRLKEEDGGKKRYKVRLVVNGFAKNKGI